MKKVDVKAPCRVDLAGGTLDLWPLYLYAGGHRLVHMAIEIQALARVQLQESKSKGLSIHIKSHDVKSERSFSNLAELKESLNKSPQKEPTRWLNRLVHFALSEQVAKLPQGKLSIECSSETPPGSGLGGSSVMGVALSRALEKTFLSTAKQSDPWVMQERVRNLEAVEIAHPAGEQDYVPALFGGLLIFDMDAKGKRIKRLPDKLALQLGKRIALVYTGKPHHSGINNWKIFQNFHDSHHPCREHLLSIHKSSLKLAEELEGNSTARVAEILNEEWDARMKLGPGVNSPELDRVWEAGRRYGAVARKACGAGGGGCMMLYFEDEKKCEAFYKMPLIHPSWLLLKVKAALSGVYKEAK
jgi:D-glycero-alpha-D-manno-heptose-7-phosphate kinase